MSLLAATRLCSAARGALGVLHSLGGQARGMKGKVLRKPMWEGWPRFAPAGWPYARAMKKAKEGKYMTKQAWRRANGRDKGLMAQELQLKMQQVPAFSRTDAPEHAGDLQGAATRDGSG